MCAVEPFNIMGSELFPQTFTVCLNKFAGYAVFAKCGNRSCPDEKVQINVGDPITFNIRISFVGAGAANLTQEINALYLRTPNNTLISSMPPQYVLGITINATIESSGNYTVTVESLDPESGSTDSFSRRFVVEVEAIQPSSTQG